MTGVVSRDMSRLLGAIGAFAEWSLALPEERPCYFLFGNPHEVAPAPYVDALHAATHPSGKDHFAYKMNEVVPTEAVAAGLRARFGLPFEAEDVFMTNGNFAGLSIVLRTIADPGDEVVFLSPPWFFYETLILAAGATPVRVRIDPVTFDPDLEAIAGALSERTRAIIVNSTHNPIYRVARSIIPQLARVSTIF